MRLRCACGDALGNVPATRWILELAVDVEEIPVPREKRKEGAVCKKDPDMFVEHGFYFVNKRFQAPKFGKDAQDDMYEAAARRMEEMMDPSSRANAMGKSLSERGSTHGR